MLLCSNRGASMDTMVFITRLLKTADGAQQLGDTSLAETAIDFMFEVLDAVSSHWRTAYRTGLPATASRTGC
jgi:hypothetical protein